MFVCVPTYACMYIPTYAPTSVVMYVHVYELTDTGTHAPLYHYRMHLKPINVCPCRHVYTLIVHAVAFNIFTEKKKCENIQQHTTVQTRWICFYSILIRECCC